MALPEISGIIGACLTPFKDGGGIDFDALQQEIDFIVADADGRELLAGELAPVQPLVRVFVLARLRLAEGTPVAGEAERVVVAGGVLPWRRRLVGAGAHLVGFELRQPRAELRVEVRLERFNGRVDVGVGVEDLLTVQHRLPPKGRTGARTDAEYTDGAHPQATPPF